MSKLPYMKGIAVAVGGSIMFWLLQRNRKPTTPAKIMPIPQWSIFEISQPLNDVVDYIQVSDRFCKGYTINFKVVPSGPYCCVYSTHQYGKHNAPSELSDLHSYLEEEFGEDVGPIEWTKERP